MAWEGAVGCVVEGDGCVVWGDGCVVEDCGYVVVVTRLALVVEQGLDGIVGAQRCEATCTAIHRSSNNCMLAPFQVHFKGPTS